MLPPLTYFYNGQAVYIAMPNGMTCHSRRLTLISPRMTDALPHFGLDELIYETVSPLANYRQLEGRGRSITYLAKRPNSSNLSIPRSSMTLTHMAS